MRVVLLVGVIAGLAGFLLLLWFGLSGITGGGAFSVAAVGADADADVDADVEHRAVELEAATADRASGRSAAGGDRTAVDSAPPLASRWPGDLHGRVCIPGGEPAVSAIVQLGRFRTTNTADRGFTVPAAKIVEDHDLVVGLKGYQPAVVEDVTGWMVAHPGELLTITLPGKALTIEGRLVDSNGVPGAGWKLELCGGTPMDPSGFPPLSIEDVAAGGGVASVRTPRIFVQGRPAARNPNLQVTGDDGSFVVRGLRAGRIYTLRAWNRQTLHRASSQPILAGARGVTFVVPVGGERERVFGTVRSRYGQPQAGVRVRLTMVVHRVGNLASYHTGQRTVTDAAGRFSFAGVPRVDLLLRFNGEAIASLHRELSAIDEGRDLDIRVGRMCQFRFESSGSNRRVDSVRVLDAAGQPQRLIQHLGRGQTRTSQRAAVVAGLSPVLVVVDDATELELSFQGAVVARVGLRLSPEELTAVRW